MQKLIGCIILNNEIQLLKDRLDYEYQIYDHIIITESRQLFNGQPKPLYFEKYQDEFKSYFPKVIYDVVDSLPLPIKGNYIGTNNLRASENRWPAEAAMRNHFLRYIHYFDDDDIFLVQDCDEIANINFLGKALPILWDQSPLILRLKYKWFTGGLLETDLQSRVWDMGFLATAEILKKNSSSFTPHILRTAYKSHNGKWESWMDVCPACLRRLDNSPVSLPIDLSALRILEQDPSSQDMLGWHLSSMHCRSKNLLDLKVWSFSHAECIDSSSSAFKDNSNEPVHLLRALAKERCLSNEDVISSHAPPFLVVPNKIQFYI